jgi:hypothetical protein
MQFEKHEVVQVRQDWPQKGLGKGDRGTVLQVTQNPDGYEIEFADHEGQGRVLLWSLTKPTLISPGISAPS